MIKISDPGIKTQYTVTDFENAIKEYVGYPYAVATNSGTAAIFLALRNWGITSGHKVEIPPLCFRAIWNAVRQTGAQPVYKPPSEGVIDVMNYGFPPEENHGWILDACEGLGGDIPRNYCYAILSFNWNKPVTCGSGGMVLCREKHSEWHIRHLIDQYKDDSVYFIHWDETGYNYRMNDLQATMGMQYLKMLPTHTVIRKNIYLHYLKAGLPVVKPPKGFNWNYWITLIRTPKRDKILEAFQKNDIEARAMFTPHTREFPEVNKFAAETMCLPSSPSLRQWEKEKVIKIVREIL
jgi:dTDP-4-amino-4,6-dideoxygalactose transaminase